MRDRPAKHGGRTSKQSAWRSQQASKTTTTTTTRNHTMKISRSIPSRIAGLSALLGLTILGGTVASRPAKAELSGLSLLPGDADVIYACYVPNSGTLYRIKAEDPTETCKS